MKRLRLVVMIVAGLFPLGAVAQGQCPGASRIIAIADTLLAEREAIGRFQVQRLGSEAAYLKIAYGDLGPEEVDALYASLIESRITHANDLLGAYRIAQSGIGAGLRVYDPDPARAFTMAGPSVLRALLLADNGLTYFSLMRRVIDDPELEPQLSPWVANSADILNLVPAQPDDVLLAMSQNAEAAGFIPAAAVLAADMTTLDTFWAIIDRHPDDPYLVAQGSLAWVNYSGAMLHHNTGPIGAVEPERAASEAAFHALLRGQYWDGPASYNAVFTNQTGWLDEGATVANAFVAEVEAGRLDPKRDPEAGWLFQYRAWAAIKGREDAQRVLNGFEFPGARIRHFSNTATTTLDWMIAKEALRPYLTGEVGNIPTRPALLSDDFEWDMWVSVATMLGDDIFGLIEAGPDQHLVALELLADTGRYEEMETLARITLEPRQRVFFLRDVIIRMDQLCEGWTILEGDALNRIGNFLFRF